jgi:hypothetical protein
MVTASEVRASNGRMRLSVRTGWFRGFLAVGLGAGGGAAIILELAQIFAHDPREGFDVLKSWGPWAMVVGLVVFLVYQLAAKSIDAARDAMNAWVGTAKTQAEASTRTADALTKLAEQGGRQGEEVRRLAIYAVQEFPSLNVRLDKQDETLAVLVDGIKSLHTRLDEKARGRDGS